MKRQPHGDLGKKAPGLENSICKGPEAGMSLAFAGYKEKAMWLELSEYRGEETGEDRGTRESDRVGMHSSQQAVELFSTFCSSSWWVISWIV